jgi:hypothetical protein
MGTGASKARRKNKVRQNAMVVGSLQVNAKRISRSKESAQTTLAEPEEETKPISLVDTYEVNDSHLFKSSLTTDQFVPYFKAWLIRVIHNYVRVRKRHTVTVFNM